MSFYIPPDNDEQRIAHEAMRAGIIGLGRIGFDFGLDKNRSQPASHYHCYQKLGAEIAICDNDENLLKSLALTPNFYTGYQEMLDDFQPQIVSICTPTSTHKDIALAVAECKSVKTIFIEKPIAQSLGEADEIIRAAVDRRKQLAINYSRRWSKVYSQIRNNLIGPVNLVGVHPGPLIRTGTHMIDLFNWMASYDSWDQVEVQAFGKPTVAPYMAETEDFNINGQIKYNPSTATLLGNLDVVPQNTVIFEFTALTKDMKFKVTENGCRTEYFTLTASKRYDKLNEYRRTFLVEDEPENLLMNAISQLMNIMNITGPFTHETFCTGLDARRDLQIALALHYSATHGNRVVRLSELPYDYTVRSH